MKGIRIGEDDLMRGGKINIGKAFKSVGKDIKNVSKVAGKEIKDVSKIAGREIKKESIEAGRDIKKSYNKKFVDSGLRKDLVKGAIRTSTNILLPAAGTLASMALGDPTGMSGAAMGQLAGQELQRYAENQGYGLYKSLHKAGFNKIGINKKSIHKTANKIGKQAVRSAAEVAAMALTVQTGNPVAGEAFKKIAIAGANKAIDSGSAKQGMKAAGKKGVSVAKKMAVEAVDDYVDRNLSGVSHDVVQKAMAGKFPEAEALIYDTGMDKIEEMINPFIGGYGVVRKTRQGLRIGRGRAVITPAYEQSMQYINMGGAISSAHPVGASSSFPQTGAPYADLSSSAMRQTFYNRSPQLSGFKEGGSFIPAGMRYGGSFLPA